MSFFKCYACESKIESLEKEIEVLKEKNRDLERELKKFITARISPMPNQAISEIINMDDINRIKQEAKDLYKYISDNLHNTIPLNQYSLVFSKLSYLKQIKDEKWRQGGRGIFSWLEDNFESIVDCCDVLSKQLKFDKEK